MTRHLPDRRHQRGISLIEALVAFLVTALGMLALVGLQSTLRFNSDIAKQRSEAVRLAQVDVESQRDFSTLVPTAGVFSYAEIDSVNNLDPLHEIEGYTTNTAFTLRRTVTADSPVPGLLTLKTEVTWTDRNARERGDGGDGAIGVVLDTIIAAVDPALSGLLRLSPSGQPSVNPTGRIPNVPFRVRDLEDGRSVYKPVPGGTVAWVFDNSTGLVTSRCTVPADKTTEELSANDLSGCTVLSGYLLTGYVRFATDAVVDAAAAENPTSQVKDLAMALTLTRGTYNITPTCYDNAPTAGDRRQISVQYACLVVPDQSERSTNFGKWSGRLVVTPVGWAYGTQADRFRLCRYSDDYNRSGAIDNPEHPAEYAGVAASLLNQNFLVIAGPNSCPTDVPANPGQGDLVDSNTVQMIP